MITLRSEVQIPKLRDSNIPVISGSQRLLVRRVSFFQSLIRFLWRILTCL
jgi:hypothetical protein